jgi:isopentenyl-diphosphate delta-isomerase
MLHRAFSVFLFSRDGKLLLQQRSGAKITFPLRWTNTCCSHPLDIDGEREEKGHLGVKRAAVRKLEHELGIKRGAVPVEALKFLTRIYYLAESDNETWGEHEIDHILFAQCDVACAVNENEVAGVMWVTKEELQRLFAERAQRNVVLTPWFEMIANQFLFKWWDQLDHIMKTPGDLADAEAHAIHHLRLN